MSKVAHGFLEIKFSSLMERFLPFEEAPVVAVGVSGGSDSLALTLLLQRWLERYQGRLCGLIVDHGLRPESSAEAEAVKSWLNDHHIEAHILPWRGPKPTAHIQMSARVARVNLMQDWCVQNQVLHLFLAHHCEDQFETFLLRQEKASDLDGLAGMSSIVIKRDLRVLRPLLALSKEELRVYLRERAQTWIEDPSNINPKFARSQLRQGIDFSKKAHSCVELLEKLGQLRNLWQRLAACFYASYGVLYPEGYGQLSFEPWAKLPKAFAQDILKNLIKTIGTEDYAPKRKALDRLFIQIHALGFKSATLGGCLIVLKKSKLFVMRETAAISREDQQKHSAVFDNRFLLSYDLENKISKTTCLEQIQNPLKKEVLSSTAFKYLPRKVAFGLPVLFERDKLKYLYRFGCYENLNDTPLRGWFRPKYPLTNSFSFLLNTNGA